MESCRKSWDGVGGNGGFTDVGMEPTEQEKGAC